MDTRHAHLDALLEPPGSSLRVARSALDDETPRELDINEATPDIAAPVIGRAFAHP